MATVMVTGSNGQLGAAVQNLSVQHPQHRFLFLQRSDLTLTDEAAVAEFVQTHKPQYIINCAAYTAVDKAETDADAAFAINRDAVAYLAKASTAAGSRLIHISTDYVFDGTATAPYSEGAATNPTSVYGASKRGGEEACLQYAADNSIIIRTSWVYSSTGHNFVKTVLRILGSGKDMNVVSDQQGTPTFAPDLAAAILQIINSKNWQPGIYHFTNSGETTWYQFASAVKEMTGLAPAVNPIPTSAYPTPARRPAYSVLGKEKIIRNYNIQLVPWQESLKTCLAQLQTKS